MPHLHLEITDHRLNALIEVRLSIKDTPSGNWRLVDHRFSELSKRYTIQVPLGEVWVRAELGQLTADHRVLVQQDAVFDRIIVGHPSMARLRFGNRTLPYHREDLMLGVVFADTVGGGEERGDQKLRQKGQRTEQLNRLGIESHTSKERANGATLHLIDSKQIRSAEGDGAWKKIAQALKDTEEVRLFGPVLPEVGGKDLMLTGDVYLKLQHRSDWDSLSKVLEGQGFSLLSYDENFPLSALCRYNGLADLDFLDALERLMELEEVETLEPAVPVESETTAPVYPQDVFFPLQWHLRVCRLPEAWGLVPGHDYGNPNIPIAVLDQGIKTSGNGGTIDHPDFNTNIDDTGVASPITGTGTPAIGPQKIYYSFDYKGTGGYLLAPGNDLCTGNHGTKVTGTLGAASAARTVGVNTYHDAGVGVMPNARIMSITHPGSSGASGLTWTSSILYQFMYLHLGGLDPGWLRAGISPASTAFPKNFKNRGLQNEPTGSGAQNPNNYTLGTSQDKDGPGAYIFNNSNLLTSTQAGTDINILGTAIQQITLLGRNRKGCLLFASATNADAPSHQHTSFGQSWNMMLVAASSIDQDGNELKGPYSSYSNEYDQFVEFAAPGNNSAGGGVYFPPKFTSIFTSGLTSVTPFAAPEESGLGIVDVMTTIAVDAPTGSSILEVAYRPDAASSAPLPFIAVLKRDNVTAEYVIGTMVTQHAASLINTKLTILGTSTPHIILNNSTKFDYFVGNSVAIFTSNNARFCLNFGGTSAASPIAAGIAGLILSANANLSWMDVRQVMRETAVPISLRHRGVSSISSILDWRQFGYPDTPVDLDNPGSFDHPGTYANALPLVDANHQLIRNTAVNDDPISVWVSGATNELLLESTKVNVGPVADFKVRQAILIGWETIVPGSGTLAVGTTSITVADATGFDHNNASTSEIRIGKSVETVLLTVDGTNKKLITVNSTDGFKVKDKLLVGTTEAEILAFGTTSTNDDVGLGGSCSRIELDVDILSPPGTIVKIDDSMTETIFITNVSGNTLTLANPGLAKSHTYSAESPLVVELLNAELRVITKIELDGTDNLLHIDKLKYAHPVPFLVTGGRIADYNHAFGFGRLDAAAAVEKALAFDFNERDLYIRDHNTDAGNANTTVAISSPDIWTQNTDVFDENGTGDGDTLHQTPKYDSVDKATFAGTGTDDLTTEGDFSGNVACTFEVTIDATNTNFSWMKLIGGTNSGSGTAVPITAGTAQLLIEGVKIKFAGGTHTIGDKWTFGASPRYIYIKVKNRGTKPSYPKALNAGSKGVNQVRFFLTLKSNNMLTMDNYVLNNTTLNSYHLNSGNEGTRLLNPAYDNFASPIRAGGTRIFRYRWPADELPPRNVFTGTTAATSHKLFLLGEVVPHDGPLFGDTPADNNNMSYRQILMAGFEFKTTGSIDLPKSIPVDELGNEVTTSYAIEMRAESGDFMTEFTALEFKRAVGASEDIAKYEYRGGAWTLTYPQGATGWVTASAPIEPVNNVAATGAAIRVRFDGDFKVSKLNSLLTITALIHSDFYTTEQIVIASSAYPIIIAVPGAEPEAFAPTPPKLYPRSFAFADMANLTQGVGEGFGPTSSTVFRVTSSFTAASNTNAYAVVDGTVFVQEGASPGLVNLVIKPLTQGINGFTPVKYFVYRGLVRTDFIDGTDPTLVTPLSPGNNSEWIAWLYGIHQNLNGVVPFESKALGFDPANQLATSLLEKYYFTPDPDFQLPPALKGVQLGTFSTAAGAAGIDVVLEEGTFAPTLAYVRFGYHEIDVSGAGGAFAARAQREQVLGFLDAAAYYGLHVRENGYVEHIVSGNVVKVQPDDIYAVILAPFLSKNTLYIDVRDETGASYNFSGHHPAAGTGDNMELGLVSGTLTGQTYQTNDWPLLIRSNTGSPVSTPEDYNAVYLRMLTDHITKPILHIEHGDIENADLLQRECFVEGDNLFVTGNTYTEELGFTHPNVLSPGGGPDDKLNVAWVIKLHLGMQEDGPVAWNTIPGVLPTENLYDNRFGPMDLGEIWDTGVGKVRWVANQARKYIDGSLRNFGYVSDRGLVYEGDVDANANPGRVLFFANAVHTFKTDEEMARSKGMSGGFSKMPSFFQELPDMKKLNLLFGVIDDAGTDVKSLQLIPLDSTAPQAESMMFVGLDKNEYLSLKTLAPGFSPDYPVSLKLEQVFSNMDYRKFKVGLQGLNTSGVAGSAFPTSDIHVYTTNDVLCFSSAFSAAQPAPDAYKRNAEEAVGAMSRTAIIASILRVPTTNEVVLPGDYVDQISPKDMVSITDSATPTPNNNGGPWSILQRTYDRATDSTTVKLSGATLTIHLATDGQLKIAERKLEEHFIDFDNQGVLSGLPEMSQIVADFDAALSPIVDGSTAKAALLSAINDAPAKALQRARLAAANSNNANADDRILYWARIKMAVALKSNAAMNAKLGTKDYDEIIDKFESVTRGYEGIDFSSVPVGIKKVIIMGFDLFQIKPTGPYEDNPSAAMALALHGKTLKDSGGVDRVFVQSALFPVRYADFDGKDGKGVVEKVFKRFFDTGDPNYVAGNVPHMVISLSQTPFAGEIKLERFVCRNRGLGKDNLQLSGKQIPAEFGGSEFYEADLDPTKFKRSSNTGFPAGDLGTRITVQKAEFNHYFNNVFIYKVGTAESRFTCEANAAGASVNDFYQMLPDGVAKVETTTDTRLTGLVPTAANILAQPGLKSVRGSGGNFFSNEIGYRIAYLREKSNITPSTDRPKTGHYHVARLVAPARPFPRNFPNPQHLDLETLKNLIDRMGEIIVDGNLP